MFIDANCGMHQMHLSVQAGLRRIERHVQRQKRHWKYFASVSKIMHCWRERARPVFETWRRLHGDESAVAHAKALPPRCISGRWGSISASEHVLDYAGSVKVRTVFAIAMDKMDKKTDAAAAPLEDEAGLASIANGPALAAQLAAAASAAGELDEMRIEAQQAYSQRMGRWKREALQAVQARTNRHGRYMAGIDRT